MVEEIELEGPEKTDPDGVSPSWDNTGEGEWVVEYQAAVTAICMRVYYDIGLISPFPML